MEIKLNGLEVLEPRFRENWSNHMLKQLILKRFGDDPVKKMEIGGVYQSTAVTNEALDLLLKLTCDEEGYEKFALNSINSRDLKEPIDEAIIERLYERLLNVKDLSIS